MTGPYRRGVAITVVVVATLMAACSAREPRVTRAASYPLVLAPVFVTLKTPYHRRAVESALARAGIPRARGVDDVVYTLRVHTGASNGHSERCGTLRNVKFLLDFAVDPHQQPVKRSRLKALRISARGYDGDCRPNVFDDMAELLRENMRARSSR